MAPKAANPKPRGFLAKFRAWSAQERVGHALRSWRTLNDVLGQLSEPEVAKALETEEGNKRRGNVLRRLRQRLAKIRRDELMNKPL